MRAKHGYIVLIAGLLFASAVSGYALWVWNDTRCVMDELTSAAASDPREWDDIFQDSNYELRPFLPFKNGPDGAAGTIDSVTRHFAWAWGNEGFILVRKQETRTDNVSGQLTYSEELRVDIERDEDGRWGIVAWSSLH